MLPENVQDVLVIGCGPAGSTAATPFAKHQHFVEAGIDIFEDAIDTFWEYPLSFATLHQRYPAEMIDCLAGRVFERQPNAADTASRELLQRARAQDAAAPQGLRFQDDPVRWRRNWDAISEGTDRNTVFSPTLGRV